MIPNIHNVVDHEIDIVIKVLSYYQTWHLSLSTFIGNNIRMYIRVV